MAQKIGILSLGCPKNLVDSEALLAEFAKDGYQIVDEVAESDIAIVNTCAFIEDAKNESIGAILDLIELKKQGKIKKVIVAGCLPERYQSQLGRELKEVDKFCGVRGFTAGEADTRLLITPGHFAYIKVSEGCDNKCNYCVISRIRGAYKSRPVDFVLKEIKNIYDNSGGALGEINLISQDLTYYGMDLYGRQALPELLRKLNENKFIKATKNLRWVRLLYCHPAHFNSELISIIKDSARICKYIDLPVQHINDRILKMMGRRVTKRQILELLDKLREGIPDIAIRSSLIVGLPGEGEEEFRELLEFIKEVKFQRLGIFTYSREEGTPAYNFKGHISEKEKKRRLNEAMKLQQEVSRGINEKFLGTVQNVLIDERDEKDANLYIGRTYADAPEVDGQVFVKTKKPLNPGNFVDARITDTLEYDLVGEAA